MKTKKIALFGASGRTGSEILNQALERYLLLNVLVRDPSKIKRANPNFETIQGLR